MLLFVFFSEQPQPRHSNSWGAAWGLNGDVDGGKLGGFFKIERGNNCLAIETDGQWGVPV